MQDIHTITKEKVLIGMIVFIACFGAILTGYFLSYGETGVAAIIGALILICCWTVGAGELWWLPIPTLGSFGGVFYLGFKLYPHEIALAMTLAPLILSLATHWQGSTSGRQKPAASIMLLVIYVALHCFGSLLYNKYMGYGSVGNVVRGYMNAFWPMVFFLVFYFFGSTKHLPLALKLLVIATFLRVISGTVQYFSPSIRYIPGINYVLPGSGAAEGTSPDLRGSCLYLCAMCLCISCYTRAGLKKTILIVLGLLCFPISLLGGGRAMGVIIAILPFFLLFIQKRILPIMLMGLLAVLGIVFVNATPETFEMFPMSMQRAASVVLINDNNRTARLEILAHTAVSDNWHRGLTERGKARWLESEWSILFGNGLRPISMEAFDQTDPNYFENIMDNAAKVGAFEKGLWNVLSIYGIVGFVLYFNTFVFLLKGPVHALWKDGVASPRHVFYFLATFLTVVWYALCYNAGGLPSPELFFALIAKVAYDDNKREELKRMAPVAAPSQPEFASSGPTLA